MEKKIIKLFEKNFSYPKLKLNEPLEKYTSFRIGGPADIFVIAKELQDIQKAYRLCKEYNTPFFILGGGTNLLVSDNGFYGVVIKNEIFGIKQISFKGVMKGKKPSFKHIYLKVNSGVQINQLVRYSLDGGLDGLQYFLGQPGTVGGALYINAHNMKKGVFFGDLVTSAVILSGFEIKQVNADYFKFAYDSSSLQKSNDIVLSVILKLGKEDPKLLWQKANKVVEYRRQNQPLGQFSAGCVFRNISKAQAVRLGTPNFTCSAGFLLDACGLKGKSRGYAYYSIKHANFIINREGKAKSADVYSLIQLAKVMVKERFGIDLAEEIVYLGSF